MEFFSASSAGVSQDGGVAIDEPGYGFDHPFLLRLGKPAADRERQALGCRPFGVRELAATMTQVGETGLQMKRHRVVNLRADAALVQMPFESVAVGRTDDELIENVPAVRRLDR